MHFSIPDTQEIKEVNNSTYISYNVHINGIFHCSVRYRQLHNLHQQMCKDVGSSFLPPFPPKKFLQLTPLQIEERKLGLEKYILNLSQNPRVLSSNVFNGWLIWAQNETQYATSGRSLSDSGRSLSESGRSLSVIEESVPLDVYLMNGQKHTLRVTSTLQTNDLLMKLSKQLNIPSDLIPFFALFMTRKDPREMVIIKKLHDFESPYLCQINLDHNLRITLRKTTWEPGDDNKIMADRVGLGLVYMQTVAEIEMGWIEAPVEVLRQLAALQAKGAKRDYLEIARKLDFYGYTQFQKCICDYPKPNTPVLISTGNREINLRVPNADDGTTIDGNFKITRIKCWRISLTKSDQEKQKTDQPSIKNNHSTSPPISSSWPTNLNAGLTCSFNGVRRRHKYEPAKLELSFEYLLHKDELQWVKIVSSEAVLMSLCLQGMVQRLLGWKPPERVRKTSLSFLRANGSSVKVTIDHTGEPVVQSETASPIGELSWRRLSERLSDLTGLDMGGARGGASTHVENSAFNNITDDNL